MKRRDVWKALGIGGTLAALSGPAVEQVPTRAKIPRTTALLDSQHRATGRVTQHDHMAAFAFYEGVTLPAATPDYEVRQHATLKYVEFLGTPREHGILIELVVSRKTIYKTANPHILRRFEHIGYKHQVVVPSWSHSRIIGVVPKCVVSPDDAIYLQAYCEPRPYTEPSRLTHDFMLNVHLA